MWRFIGTNCEMICDTLTITVNSKAKNYYRLVTDAMVGSIDCENVNILKTVCVKENMMPKESMSLPSFDYRDFPNETWLTSNLHHLLTSPMILFVFMKDDCQMREDARFIGCFLWEMSDRDLTIVEEVWNRVRNSIEDGSYGPFPKISDDCIVHVRPHGRDSNDLCPCPDGISRIKSSFFINAFYIGMQVRHNLHGTDSHN
jgi:hypothetical protein